MSDTTVVIYNARNLQQAQLLNELLDDEGIEARIVNDGLQAVAGELPFGWVTSPRVVVREADVAAARAVAEAFDKRIVEMAHDGPEVDVHDDRAPARQSCVV